MTTHVIWHGTPAEAQDLTNAVARNCVCKFTDGARVDTCPSHAMMLGSQKAMDGLLFTRRRLALHEPHAAQRVYWMEP